MAESMTIPKKLLHELNEKRRDIAEEVRGSAWDSPTRMHHTAKAAGMDKGFAFSAMNGRTTDTSVSRKDKRQDLLLGTA